jgi:tRNA pseudouridine(55) synthase
MFFLIDKPIGMSSFDVIRDLRRQLGIKKMWHAGTLDPLASGLLLVATDGSTKLLPLLDDTAKTYEFSVRIDGTTASLDLGTGVTPVDISAMKSRTAGELQIFLASQKSQIPPSYSALHIDGERAYDRVRRGEEIQIKPRDISVEDVIILDYAPPLFRISLRISHGGYIRSFAPVIGWFFGVDGGYITDLRRTILHLEWCDLERDHALPLREVQRESSIPYETLFPHIESYTIDTIVYQQLTEWREIANTFWELSIWQKIFVKYSDNFIALLQFSGDGLQIIRNNV